MSTNEGFEDVLRFWFSSLPTGDHAAMVAKWSGGFAVARILRSSNGFHHYWIEPSEVISTTGHTVRGRG